MTEHQIFILVGLVSASLVWSATHGARWPALSQVVLANVRLLAGLTALTFGLIVLRTAPHSLPYWSQFTMLVYAAVGLTVWVGRDSFAERFVPPASARQLGWIRAVTCASLLVLVLKDDLTSTLLVPEEFQRFEGPVGALVQRFPSVFALREPDFLLALQRMTIIALVMGVLGLATRLVIPVAAACFTLFDFTLISYSHFFHSGFLPLQLLYLLSFLPADHGFSLDAALRRHRGRAPRELAPQTYGYAVFACVALYGLAYFDSGLSKLSVDPLWADAQNMKALVLSDASILIDRSFGLNLSIDYVRRGLPDALFGLLGAGAMMIEASGIVLVFRQRWAKVIAPAIVSLHLGIFLFQKFLFADLVVMPLMFVSLDWLMTRLGRPSKDVVPRAEGRRWPWALATACVTVVVLGGWWCGWEVFPLATHWGMYSVAMQRNEVTYRVLTAEYRDGTKRRIDLTREIDFLGHARWLDVVSIPKGAHQTARLQALFENYTRAHNAKHPAERHIARIRLELRRWHFAQDPQNPSGQSVREVVFEIPAALAHEQR
jgi:hypothetical protein